MKKNRVINNLTIKQTNDNKFSVISPSKTIIYDNVTNEEAISFCENNFNFVNEGKLNRTQFLNETKDGKWYWFNKNTIVKIKNINEDLITLWLSLEYDNMSLTEYSSKFWSIENSVIKTEQGDVYAFAELTGEIDDIYDDNGKLILNKMFNLITSSYENKKFKLVNKEELKEMWRTLLEDQISMFPKISFI